MVGKAAPSGSDGLTEGIQRGAWSIFETMDMWEAARKAKDLGWEQNKVQVRAEMQDTGQAIFFVEPYESDCSCRGILRYQNFWPQN